MLEVNSHSSHVKLFETLSRISLVSTVGDVTGTVESDNIEEVDEAATAGEVVEDTGEVTLAAWCRAAHRLFCSCSEGPRWRGR